MGYFMLILGILGVLVGIGSFAAQDFIIGVIFIIFSGYLLLGLKSIQQQERAVVELFGGYITTLKPGLQWILPGVMKIRAIVSTWELTLPLFEQPIKIDFRDGSAVPRGTEVFVKIKDPDTRYSPPGKSLHRDMTGVERAIYEIQNWRTAIKDIMENALRSYLNGLTIDEGITKGRAGFDLKNQLPEEEVDRLDNVLANWGFEFLRITVQDFDLESALVEARGRVQIRKREAEAAPYVAQRRAEETVGATIEMMALSHGKSPEEIKREIDGDPELKKEFLSLATDLLKREMAISGKSFVDIRVEGAEGAERVILNALAAWKRMPTGGKGVVEKPPRRTRESPPESPPELTKEEEEEIDAWLNGEEGEEEE